MKLPEELSKLCLKAETQGRKFEHNQHLGLLRFLGQDILKIGCLHNITGVTSIPQKVQKNQVFLPFFYVKYS